MAPSSESPPAGSRQQAAGSWQQAAGALLREPASRHAAENLDGNVAAGLHQHVEVVLPLEEEVEARLRAEHDQEAEQEAQQVVPIR